MEQEPRPGGRFLIEAYFYDVGQCRGIRRGETLIRQGEANERLYLITEGCLSARGTDVAGDEYEVFRAGPQMFVGVYSFFSETYKSPLTIVAEEDSRLCYIDRGQLQAFQREGVSLYEEFMPVVVSELMLRHRRTLELSREKERTLQKLLHSDKMASLGQMAAGVAHELNNAVAVLERNTHWLAEHLEEALKLTQQDAPVYRAGLQQGSPLSTRQVRQRARQLEEDRGLEPRLAARIAETGLDDKQIIAWTTDPDRAAGSYRLWRIGTALHHMLSAAHQAAHVVKSIRTLGAPHSERRAGVDLNETLREALSLLQSSLRQIEVNLALEPLPPLVANSGELVQIWTNLIKNACESMLQAGTPQPRLDLCSRRQEGMAVVEVVDNGPGIPPGLLPRVFQPDVTTKVEGLSFGLGLGLTIVQRLAQEYGGSVGAESAPGRTVLTVTLPLQNP